MIIPPSAWAGMCSLCRETLRTGGSAGLLRGYYWSIVLLASIPLVVIGIGVYFGYKRYTRES